MSDHYVWTVIDVRGHKEGRAQDWAEVDLGFSLNPYHVDRTCIGIPLPDALVDCLRGIVRWHDEQRAQRPVVDSVPPPPRPTAPPGKRV